MQFNINRYSAGETSNFSTDALHLSKLGSQSAYALMGGDCETMFSAMQPSAIPPPPHFYIRNY
jgi:hypothetical protein